MQFFGDPWPSGICDALSQTETPVGEPCGMCEEPIQEGERGITMPFVTRTAVLTKPVHRECHLRSTVGGIEHLTAGPHAAGDCYEGSTLTYRQSALAAWDFIVKGVELPRGPGAMLS